MSSLLLRLFRFFPVFFNGLPDSSFLSFNLSTNGLSTFYLTTMPTISYYVGKWFRSYKKLAISKDNTVPHRKT